jgi:hypothetical protein
MRNHLVKVTALLCPVGKVIANMGTHQQSTVQVLKQLQMKLNERLEHHYTQTLRPSLLEETSQTIADAPPFHQ